MGARNKRRLLKLLDMLGLPPVIFKENVRSKSSFYLGVLPVLKLILIARRGGQYHLDHEVGHHHLSTYYGTVIDPEEFTRLFGSRYRWYFGLWYFSSQVCDSIGEHKDYVTAYARVHPLEDYAETFVLALQDIEKNVQNYYGSKKLNAKVSAVKRWIKASQKLADEQR